MMEYDKIKKDIEKLKKKLIIKAKKTGIYENFGQKEVSILKDKYSDCIYTDSKSWNLIEYFDTWCMDFSDEDIK